MLLRGERRPEETSGDQKRPVETIILSDLFVGREADSRNHSTNITQILGDEEKAKVSARRYYFGIGQIAEKIREPSFLLTREMRSLARVHSRLEPELGRGEPRAFGQRDTASVSWSGSVKLRARAHDEGLLPVRESVHACAAWLNNRITWAGSAYSIVVRS